MLKNLLVGLILAVLAASPLAGAVGADYGSKTKSEGEIKVTVTPQFSADAQSWDFEVVMETHTRSLNDDMAKTSMLVVDGMQYQPLGWDGAPPGGHHRKGMLRFKAVSSPPRMLELQIRLKDDAAPRSFRWESE